MTITRRNFISDDSAIVSGGLDVARLSLTVEGTARLNGYVDWTPSPTVSYLASSLFNAVNGDEYPSDSSSTAQFTVVGSAKVLDMSYVNLGSGPKGYILPSSLVYNKSQISIFSISSPESGKLQAISTCRAIASSVLLINLRELENGDVFAGIRRSDDEDLASITITPTRRGGWAAVALSIDFDDDKFQLYDLISGSTYQSGIPGDSGLPIQNDESDLKVRALSNSSGFEYSGLIADLCWLPYSLSDADVEALKLYSSGRLYQIGV